MEIDTVKNCYPEDFSTGDIKRLQDFRSSGLPGITNATVEKVAEATRLYIAGKTYREISQITHLKMEVVLYLSDRNNWHKKRMDRFKDISEKLLSKKEEVMVETANSVSSILSMMNQYYDKKMIEYAKNNDDEVIEKLDTKVLSQYLKVVELVNKLMSKENPELHQIASKINININGNAEIKEEKVVDVSNYDKGSILKELLKQAKKE